jgi:uncharacterized protein involved in outer membrane biogenesis
MASSSSAPRPRRTGRKLLIILLALIALVVIVLAILPSVVSLESFKAQIETRAEQALHRKVDIGQVRLQILTGLGAGLENLVIDNPPQWQQEHFVKVGTLSVKVAFLPLLRGRVEISKIILRDGDVFIERDAQGRMNYDDLIAPKAKGAPPASPSEPPSEGSPLGALLVSKVSLRNVNVSFIDRMAVAGKTVTTTARDMQADLNNIALNTPIDFDMATALLTDGERNVRLRGRVGPVPESLAFDQVPVDVTLNATALQLDRVAPYMGPDPALTAGRLGAEVHITGSMASGLELKGSMQIADARLPAASGQGKPLTLPTVSLNHDLRVNLSQSVLQVNELRLDLPPLQATLTGSVRRFTATPEFDLQLTTNEFATADVLAQLPMLAAAIPASNLQARVKLQAKATGTPERLHSTAQLAAQQVSLTMGDGAPVRIAQLGVIEDATLDLAKSTMQVAKLQVTLKPLQLTLNGTINQLASTPQVDLRLTSNQFDPGQAVATFPMLAAALPESTAMQGKIKLQGSVKGTPGNLQADTQIVVDALSIKSGAFRDHSDAKQGLLLETSKTQVKANTHLAAGKQPDVRVDVQSQRLVFDQRGGAETSAAATSAPQADTSASAPPKPLAPPVNLRGKATIAEGRIKGFEFRQLVADFSLIGGLFKSAQSFRMFDGTYSGKLQANLAQPRPDYTVDMQLDDVNAGSLVNEMAPVKNVLLGVLNTNVKLSGKGLDWKSISKTLTGNAGVQISSLKLTTLDLMPKLTATLEGVSKIAGFSVPEGLAQRSFDTLNAALQVTKGKIQAENLKLSGQDLLVLAQGLIGLDTSLNLQGTAFLLDKLAAGFGKKAAFLRDKEGRIPIPFTLRGSLTKPIVAPNERALLELAQKAVLGQVGQKAGEELQKLLPPAVSGSTGSAPGKLNPPTINDLQNLLPSSSSDKPASPSVETESKQKEKPQDALQKSLKGLFNR